MNLILAYWLHFGTFADTDIQYYTTFNIKVLNFFHIFTYNAEIFERQSILYKLHVDLIKKKNILILLLEGTILVISNELLSKIIQ